MGILTLAEAELYEKDKRCRESDRERIKTENSRKQRYMNRTGQDEATQPLASGSSRELQSLRLPENKNTGDGMPNNLGLVGKQAAAVDFSDAPFFEALTESEAELCSSLRMLPVQYLGIKEDMLAINASKGFVPKQDARDVSRIDAYKLMQVHNFLTNNNLKPPKTS